MRQLLAVLSWKSFAVLTFVFLCGCDVDTLRYATVIQLDDAMNGLIGQLVGRLASNFLGLPL